MIGTFPGKLSFADGDEVDVDLEIASGQLKLVTGISEIGSWPLDLCSLAPDAADAFHLTVDGDRVRFSPDHPDAFHQFVAQLGPYGAPSEPSRAAHAVNGNGARRPLQEAVTATDAASDEDIALTLEALFASTFGQEVDTDAAPGSAAAGASPPPVPASPVPPFAESGAPGFDDTADLGPSDDAAVDLEASEEGVGGSHVAEPLSDWSTERSPEIEAETPDAQPDAWADPLEAVGGEAAIEAGSWDAGRIEIEEWSPEATAAALEAELAASADHTGPVDEVDPPDGSTLETVPEEAPAPEVGDRHEDEHDGDEPWTDQGPADAPPEDTPSRPAAHWRDFDPFEPDDEAAAPTSPAWPGEARRHAEIDPDDHLLTPPRGYGDDAFAPADHDRYADDPWSDTPDDLMTARPDEPATGGPGDPATPEGDRGWFRSTATERLASVADAIKERSEPDDEEYSVADEVRASQQQLRSSGQHRDAGRLVRRILLPLVVVAVLAGLGLFTPRFIEMIADRIEDADAPAAAVDPDPVGETVPTDSAPVDTAPAETSPVETAPTQTAPAETTPSTSVPPSAVTTVPRILMFDLPASEFAMTWNDVATGISPLFEIPNDVGSNLFAYSLTEYVGIEGRVGEDGTLDGFSVIVDPRGESKDDQLGIQALGVAIGVVDPASNGVERRDILMDLGLDVSNPELPGIDGSVTDDGVAYRLVYDEETFLLRFSLSPSGPQTPATTPVPSED